MHSSWKTKYYYYPEASSMHNKVREILLEGAFKSMKAYQEVPLKDLIDSFRIDSNMRVDWYLETFNIIIELHGRQHYEQTNFGYMPKIESNIEFGKSKFRDNLKKTALIEEGYYWLEISYRDESKLSESYLLDRIKEAINGESEQT